MNWLLSSEGIATIIQISILIVLILTFLNAYRPHVGIVLVDSIYNEAAEVFTVNIRIKNSGNTTANNVSSVMTMFYNNEALAGDDIRKSKYVLFPSQESSGHPSFNGVSRDQMANNEFKIVVEIHYEQPINSFLPIPVTIRKYMTIQELLYDSAAGKFATTSGRAT